uniref:Uncharacterized protein n=1 Tax=Manihot esculenta TaxID=3983 RepID=A0A199UAW8_MANES
MARAHVRICWPCAVGDGYVKIEALHFGGPCAQAGPRPCEGTWAHSNWSIFKVSLHGLSKLEYLSHKIFSFCFK